MTTYVDASVLLRIVLGEKEPLATWDELVPVSSELVRVECLRTIERYRVAQAFGDEVVAQRRKAVLRSLDTFRLVQPTRTVLERAADPFPVHVTTLDAIHLATALEVRSEIDDLDFATHDSKLAEAATALGFDVVGAL